MIQKYILILHIFDRCICKKPKTLGFTFLSDTVARDTILEWEGKILIFKVLKSPGNVFLINDWLLILHTVNLIMEIGRKLMSTQSHLVLLNLMIPPIQLLSWLDSDKFSFFLEITFEHHLQ